MPVSARTSGVWVVVHMARSACAARHLQQELTAQGLLVRLKPVYKNRSDRDNYFEIMVLHSEADAAREILLESGFQ